ncbi:MAG: HEAT repeat domain-containing protein [Actinomycetota bacterium]
MRATGSDLLSECFNGRRPGRSDVAAALVAFGETETDTDVLWSLANALGRVGDPLGVETLVRLADHQDSDVRHQVAQALPWVTIDWRDDRVTDALIRLAGDPDPGVRNWAFGLGRLLEDDSRRIRETLWARTKDDDPDTREEAACGLARRHDPRAIPLIVELLDSGDVAVWVFEAAETLGDPSFLPYLEGYDDEDGTVEEARQACDPARRSRLNDAAAALLELLHERSSGVVWRLYCDRLGEPVPLLAAGASDDDPAWAVEMDLEAAGWDAQVAAQRIISRHGGLAPHPEGP